MFFFNFWAISYDDFTTLQPETTKTSFFNHQQQHKMFLFYIIVYQVSLHMLKNNVFISSYVPFRFFDVIQHKFLSSLHVIKNFNELTLNLASKPY